MHRRTITPDQQAAAVAGKQHGAISGRQALAAGMTQEQIEKRVAVGSWIRRVRSVFVIAGSPDTWQQRAMVAYLATERAGGVVSHVTAAAVFALLPPSPLPHVTVLAGHSPRCGVARVHRGTVPALDQQHRDGMSVTTPSRVLVDMAACLARPSLEELTDDVLCRGLASVMSVQESLERAGLRPRGGALLRRVLQVWSPKIEPGSVAEVRLLRLLADLGVTELVTQHEVYDDQGRFVARLDIARPDLRKGLEYEGVRYHGPRGWERDEPRYQRLRANGWDVRGVTKADLIPGETRLARIAGQWLAAAAA